MSALISDSKTRELIVTLEPTLVTPEVVHDEIRSYEDLIVEKPGMERDRVQQFIELLFSYIETVPASAFYQHIGEAEDKLGETDPDDVLYLACALGTEASIWSDDRDFEDQDLVPVFTTSDVIDSFDTL
ncbi:PIN domain-containing protein [Haloarcula pelagica]|uniref:PIN domain-containing protein n=1 Tax=Haloarcula pelagica TaxID=3033389 RepID=UPI0024C3FA26|nr:PIN domain-containing protein [Halomicroarcula sp. YJ-61-S]